MTEPSRDRTHRLSLDELDRAALGSMDSGDVVRLRRVERDRRLVLIRRMLDLAAENPSAMGPLASAGEVWEYLGALEEQARPVFEDLINHPYTGAWLGHTLRRINGFVTRSEPLWVDVGYVHALVAAGAVRAGRPLRIRFPIRGNYATLPTLGTVVLPADPRWAIATLQTADREAEITATGWRIRVPAVPSQDGPGWYGLRRHAVERHGLSLSVALDDLDPFRGLYGPILPRRLTDRQAHAWQQLLDDAWQLLTTYLPETAAAMSATMQSLVVEAPRDRLRSPSASSGEAFGSAVVTQPADGVLLGAMLVHEYRHVYLGGIMNLRPLHNHADEQRFYAPWRDDPRPLAGVVQGIYAFTGVAGYWRAMSRADLHRPWSTFEYAYWRDRALETVRQVGEASGLTEVGHRFLSGVRRSLERWTDEAVPADVEHTVSLLSDDHRAGWRIRHLQADPERVSYLVKHWGGPPSAPPAAKGYSRPRSLPTTAWLHHRAESILEQVIPTRLRDASKPGRRMPPTDLTRGDTALLADRTAEARDHYRSALRANPDQLDAWVGLGLAVSRSAPDRSDPGDSDPGDSSPTRTDPLLREPELVVQVYWRLRAAGHEVDPAALATWIGACLEQAGP